VASPPSHCCSSKSALSKPQSAAVAVAIQAGVEERIPEAAADVR
jgi:hypothetical protein